MLTFGWNEKNTVVKLYREVSFRLLELVVVLSYSPRPLVEVLAERGVGTENPIDQGDNLHALKLLIRKPNEELFS